MARCCSLPGDDGGVSLVYSSVRPIVSSRLDCLPPAPDDDPSRSVVTLDELSPYVEPVDGEDEFEL